jgi:hypothetical protein
MSVRKRGRVSATDLAIVPMAPLGAVERLKPPHDLTDEETEIWVAVTNTEAADWFTPSTAPLLAQYCRHVISSRRVAEMIETCKLNGVDPQATCVTSLRRAAAALKRQAISVVGPEGRLQISACRQSRSQHGRDHRLDGMPCRSEPSRWPAMTQRESPVRFGVGGYVG